MTMGIFNKLFGKKENQLPEETPPKNDVLIQLLNLASKDRNNFQNYSKVMNELVNGDSFLLLASQNDNDKNNQLTTLEKDSTLKLKCVFDVDGLKILGAFTDENSLVEYTKKETSYTSMKSQDVLNFCETNGIGRIVINSGQKNAWFTEKSKANVETETVKQDTTVQIGTPANPIEKEIIDKLILQFSTNESIIEVYQYGQTKNNEYNIVLGFKLSTYTDNSRTASIHAVQRVLENSSFNQALDIFFIESEDWYNNIKNIDNSLLYKR